MSILEYQKDCFKNYKKEIEYPKAYTYLYGNPINVLVPIETELNKVMIVGAYPSAKFFTIEATTDIPLSDIDSPFSSESYFDGSRVRTIPSGKELNEVILSKIGVNRRDCWITNLIKVFLFKDGHVKRCNSIQKFDITENRSKFDKYAKRSMKRLETEIELCNPYVIILLGVEVTKVFFKLSENKATEFLDGKCRKKEIKELKRNVICLPHPGILMKKFEKNPWPGRFENEIAVRAKQEIQEIIKALDLIL